MMKIVSVPIAIIASGMVTSVGFNAPASLAAIRAGVSGAHEVNLWDYETGEYLSGNKVALPQWWEGIEKLADLVAPAIRECLVAAEPVSPDQIPIILGVAPPDRPHRNSALEEQILEEVSHRLETTLHPNSTVLPQGQVSTVAGLKLCRRILSEQHGPYCIVAGVDSLLHWDLKDTYLSRRRLLTSNNSNGFIPGEAGAAVLVAPESDSARCRLNILGIGLARESATIDSEHPLRGDGMAEAIRDALDDAGLTIFDASYRITDLNGEHYKFKEATLAAMRFEHGQIRKELFDLWHPIEYIGEVGAAIGPCVFAIALHASEKGYAPGPIALCHFSNDNGERAAALVGYARGKGPV